MTIPATISFTESAAFTALTSFITQITGLVSGQVIQGQGNLTPEPPLPDFVVMTALRQERLETNETTYFDNVITGSIDGTVLTVATAPQLQGAGLQAGMLLIDGVWPTMNIAPNTVLGTQITGTSGGIGTYNISPSQTLALETLYAGLETDFVGTKWTIQLDIHGPNSGNNTRIIDTLFRSEYGVDFFDTASSWQCEPLYCSEARQIGFVNGENQWEERYVMDACLQINPIIGIPAQFFDQIQVQLIEGYPSYVEGNDPAAPPVNPPTNPGGLVPWSPS